MIPHVMAVAAANCPTSATEVWNSWARLTRSGPSISPERLAKRPTTQSTMSNVGGETGRGSIGVS